MQARLPDWSAVFWQPDLRYIAIHGGRGSAKSHSIARALAIKAAEAPLRVLCAREIQKSIRDSSKRILDDVIREMGLEGYTSTDTEIRHENGSLFIFAGLRSNIASIKSMEGIDIAWVDEAQSISQESMDVLIPTIRKAGSQLWFSWNPASKTDAVDVMFRGDVLPPRSAVLEVNYDSNPFFTDELRAEMEYVRARDPDKYMHVWEGKYAERSAATVFTDWRIGDDVVIPHDVAPRFGADWGFSVDPTTLVRCWVLHGARTIYFDQEAYAVGCSIADTPALFRTVPDSERFPIVADSSRPETIDHMRKNGFPKMMPAVKGPRSVVEGIEFMKGFHLVVHPRCKNLIDELRHYKYKVDKHTGAILAELQDGGDHLLDAGRYALEGDRRNLSARPPPPKVVPISIASAWGRR